jgi:hypothetical protein
MSSKKNEFNPKNVLFRAVLILVSIAIVIGALHHIDQQHRNRTVDITIFMSAYVLAFGSMCFPSIWKYRRRKRAAAIKGRKY